jgi:hypothetical protein
MGERSPDGPASVASRDGVWFIGGAAAAAGIAWVAATLNWVAATLKFHRLTPLGILSIGIGIALALALCALAKWLGLRSRKALLNGAIVLALITVFAEHAWLYNQFRQGWRTSRAENAQIAMFRPKEPWSPGEYLAREIKAGSLPYWCLDAGLIVIATLVTLQLVIDHNKSLTQSPSSP